MSLLAGLQAATGIFGLIDGIGKSRRADKMQSMAQREAEADAEMRQKARDLALGYDPAKELQAAVEAANANALDQSRKGLTQLNADFARSGGQAMDDTRFPALTQGFMARVWDPVRLWQAQALSETTQQKLAALRSTMGGDAAQNLASISQQTRPDLSGPLNIVSSAAREFLAKSKDRQRNNQNAEGKKFMLKDFGRDDALMARSGTGVYGA